MPPLPPVPSVCKIVTAGLMSNSAWANIYHFQFTGASVPTPVDMSLVCDHVQSAWTSNLANQISMQTQMTSIQALDLSSPTGAVFTKLVNVPGVDSTNPAPGNASMVIRKHIARRYRGGHPKTFLPPKGSSSMFDQDTWQGSYVTNAQGAFLAFITALLTIHGVMTFNADVNVSYYQGFTNITTPSGRAKSKPTLRPVPVVDVIQSYTAEKKIGSQRRRTSGG